MLNRKGTKVYNRAEDFECIASFIDYDGKLIAMPAKKKRQLYAI